MAEPGKAEPSALGGESSFRSFGLLKNSEILILWFYNYYKLRDFHPSWF